ncbi:MAG: hypothetical protein ACRDRO_30815 [Pseudonocardiaceae bacterium]
MVIRLAVWLLFGVVIGLLPLIARIIQDAMSKDRFSFTEVFRSGELFIVSAVIAAGAMGELFAGSVSSRLSGALRTSELWPRLLTILAGFWTLLAFAANTMAYMAVPTAPQSTVMHLSLAFFPITVLASGLSIGTAYGQ